MSIQPLDKSAHSVSAKSASNVNNELDSKKKLGDTSQDKIDSTYNYDVDLSQKVNLEIMEADPNQLKQLIESGLPFEAKDLAFCECACKGNC